MAVTPFFASIYLEISLMAFLVFSVLHSFSVCPHLSSGRFGSSQWLGENIENIFLYLLAKFKKKKKKSPRKHTPWYLLFFFFFFLPQRISILEGIDNIFVIRLIKTILALLDWQGKAVQHCLKGYLELAQAARCHPKWRSRTAAFNGILSKLCNS